ncbi:Acyl transferase domain-containing protein [Filimonas lacunae]|uniref:Acyl transferase domain-containing protein n=1 Tax=Filimonas lacunae TaxID=477680 RepID=A0A173M9B9_9BACT|nr:type I polyketide synthase [Filimonas lacunae]BAV04110.1 modular polyketide synthase [Filimonas lacunae]SIT15361.1 Acyl transferase domain-containing protein [Filimonas lacunae]
MNTIKVVGITPFEKPDVRLALALQAAGAFSVIHMGRNRQQAQEALRQMSQRCTAGFGVCFATDDLCDMPLPEQVQLVVLPYGCRAQKWPGVQVYYQVGSIAQAKAAVADGAGGLVLKGNEAGGKVSDTSSFILLQQAVKEIKNIELWVQGGVGVHTSAALAAGGATGVVADSQLVLFAECSAPKEIKQACEKLAGSETRVVDGFRVLVRPDSPAIAEDATQAALEPYLDTLSLQAGLLPLGQDVAIAIDVFTQYQQLSRFIYAIHEAVRGHLKQARALEVVTAGNAFCKDLNITFPIAQGPMTRVSDVPAFAAAVAQAGALPFVALSLLKGEKAHALIRETKQLAGHHTWGVGILGFAPPELREEQLAYIKEEKPPVVLIAGGRPSQAKPLEEIGIKTFLHVPSAALLDMFIKDGGKRFVFEGRECGGHVGPLSSLVLWEKQIHRLLQEENATAFSVLFAGGIHDALSAACIAVMAAPLAARGVKVGVLMGTAYLYTEEAVATGAILEQFQQQAMQHQETILLETAPGHETRCLASPFAAYFETEKLRLQQAGTDKKLIWEQLEKLNVGRLRIAAKGIERQGDALVNIATEEQLQTGMYMIGQVAALRREITTLAALHTHVAVENNTYLQQATLYDLPERTKKALDVAIIGMACIYPGAKNIEEFWRNIITGKDSVTEVPDERWNKALYYNPDVQDGSKSHSKWGGFIPDIDFDPVAFGIPPQSLAAIDPTQLLSLLVAKQALDDAGYGNSNEGRENVSVIIGAEGGNDLANNYCFRSLFTQIFGHIPAALDEALPKLTEDSFPGILANVISGRITNRLNLGGRNYTVDAACASSIAAIDLACQELLLEKSDMVIAGGADLHNGINDYLMFSSTHALSRKGRCSTFDAGADGIALGEGVALVVLKKYEAAVQDGDKIYAVIKGVGGSSDGKSLGLTAPRKSGQQKALVRAYEQAGISPAMVGLVEAHGTGTVVGDKTELSALTDLLLNAGALPAQTHLGSVKTQIGHTKCAAGMAGLIKAALAVYHGVKPPTIHLQTPNSYYNRQTSPFAFHTTAGIWTEANRIAGVSAFGFGGTNFHAVITNDNGKEAAEPIAAAWPCELVVFRGDTYEEARERLGIVRAMLENNDTLRLRDIAYSAWRLYNQHPVQITIVAESTEDLLLKMNLAGSGVETQGIYITKKLEGKVAFLFAGQGSQRINMARDLFVMFPAMRRLLADKPAYQQVLFPDAVFDNNLLKAQQEQMKDTRLAQPLLGVVDLAIATLLRQLGIAPDMVAGHSYGELPALCFAGAFDAAQLIPLSEQRAKAILDAVGEDKGVMVAVSCGEEELAAILEANKEVYAVNHNSPLQWVLAGKTAVMTQLQEKLRELKISFRQLEVACAFHSPLLEKSAALYTAAIKDVTFNELAMPVWSNTTAALYPVAPAAVKQRLAEHLVKPVRFSEQVRAMYDNGARLFIEVGPGKVLTGLVKAINGDKEQLLLHTEDKEAYGVTHLLTVLAKYMASGREVLMDALFEGRGAVLLNLEDGDQYKRKPTVWLVNGQMARPVTGSLPAHGAMPIITPLALTTETPVPVVTGNAHTEQLIQDYLDNVKLLVQAQRDVLLGYLGQQPPANGMAAVNRRDSKVSSEPVGIPGTSVAAVSAKGAAPVVAAPAVAITLDVQSVLMHVVSDKTGYPQEMLGMEMDLEADLSIDSIKRMEIIGELKVRLGGFGGNNGGDDAMLEQLAGLKTLSALVNWIQAHAVTTTLPVAVPGITAVATGVQPAVRSEQELCALLLQIVSDKTGYPQEMLGMEMDLEADLSIDSIKRMEIIGELKNRLGSFAQAADEDAVMEQLAAIKSLQGLMSWIAANTMVQEVVVETAAKSHKPRPVVQLARFRFELIPAALTVNNPQELTGKRFAVTEDGGLIAPCVKQLFEAHGAVVDIIPKTIESLEGYQGLIILDTFASLQKPGILDAFAMFKKVDPQKMKWVYAVSDMGTGLDEVSDITVLRNIQGYTGFLKSLDKEWEHTRCRHVSIATPLPASKVAAITLEEILHTDAAADVIYEQGERKTYEPVSASYAAGEVAGITLNKESVVLVLGGAQGITAELMVRFSSEFPCHFILVGRSPYQPGAQDAKLYALKTKEEIKKYLLQHGLGSTPAEIEKRAQVIYKQNQVHATVSALENNGSTVAYHALDIRDEAQLGSFIQQVYTQYGRLDGVVHGAGLLEDKLFNHKTTESFERVFATKVTPVRVLAEQLQPDVQFVILFSSVASVYGNKGQTDYAAANSVMDKYAKQLKRKLKGKVTVINWGPWKGTGMVTPTLEKEYERRGISMIPLAEGMEMFMDEVKYGVENQVLIMA